MENKDDLISHYVVLRQNRLKNEQPHIANRLLHDDLAEFSRKLLGLLEEKKPKPKER